MTNPITPEPIVVTPVITDPTNVTNVHVDPVAKTITGNTVEIKSIIGSKIFWAGAVSTGLGIATYFADPTHQVVSTTASISEAILGILTVVFRIWFTNKPVTGFAARALKKK